MADTNVDGLMEEVLPFSCGGTATFVRYTLCFVVAN